MIDTHTVHSLVAEVGTNQPNYTVPEDVGNFTFYVEITSGQKAPGQECEIAVVTYDGSAIGQLMVHYVQLLHQLRMVMLCASLQLQMTILHSHKL